MFILIYLSLMVLIAVLQNRNTGSKTTERPEPNPPSDPVRLLLQEQELFFETHEEGPVRSYRFNYDLHSCLARVEINLDLVSSRFVMKILLPVIVQKERATEVNRVLQSLNQRAKPLRLRLIRSSGRVYINRECQAKARDKTAALLLWKEILQTLAIADHCFPEINRAITGGNMPELAAIRIFGFQDYELN